MTIPKLYSNHEQSHWPFLLVPHSSESSTRDKDRSCKRAKSIKCLFP